MKKKRFACLALALVMLAGCGGGQGGEQPAAGGRGAPGSAAAERESGAAGTAQSEAAGQPGGAPLRMLTDIWGEESGAQSDNGYYEFYANGMNGINILYTDFATGTRVFLCSRPECDHHNENCTSWIETAYGGALLMCDGDRLYLLQKGALSREDDSEKTLMHLWRMNPDGSDRELIYTFPKTQHADSGVASDGKRLYFPMRQWDKGLNGAANVLAVLNLETKELDVPLKFQQGTEWNGVVGREVLITGWERANPYEEQGLNAVLSAGVDQPVNAITLKGWNVDTHEERIISDGEIVELSSKMYDGEYYWIDARDLTVRKIDLQSGEITILSNTLKPEQGTRLEISEVRRDQIELRLNGERCILLPGNGEILAGPPQIQDSASGKGGRIWVVAEWENKYLVKYREDAVRANIYDTDGNSEVMDVYVYRPAFISKDDYRVGVGNFIPLEDTVLN